MNTIKAYKDLDELVCSCPHDKTIIDNFIKSWTYINNEQYKSILCSISGGADSDVMLDICVRCDKDHKIRYVWFDTGLEYQATKDHLVYLEGKYDITIEKFRAIKPIPTTCKQNGQPFISKHVSEMIKRLQMHDFKWEDMSFSELLEKYCVKASNEELQYLENEKIMSKEDPKYKPKYKGYSDTGYGWYKGCVVALSWWCNANPGTSRYNIRQNKLLKEYMVANPPDFLINNVCCQYAKKDVAKKAKKQYNVDLNIVGVRKAEGGIRAYAYKSCFSSNENEQDEYRPLWWYTNETKDLYCKHYDIIHSKCYTEYKLPRTGCAGCSFARGFEDELKVIQKYEPKLFIAVNNIFGKAYEYTRNYHKFISDYEKK